MNCLSFDERESVRDRAVRRSRVLQRSGDDEIMSVVAFAAARHRSRFAALSIITGHRQILLATFGMKAIETARQSAICNTTIARAGEPLVVRDAAADPRFAHLPMVSGPPYLRFYAGAPVTDANGYPLGALCIADPSPQTVPFDPADLLMRAREIEGILRW